MIPALPEVESARNDIIAIAEDATANVNLTWSAWWVREKYYL
jgi:hypothetical protein